MTLIAGLPFTQLLNLNILGELRVKGIITTDDDVIVEETTTFTITVDDDVVIFSGSSVATANLPVLSSVIKRVTVANSGTATLTIDPFGAELINGLATEALTPNQSVTLVPTSAGWLTV